MAVGGGISGRWTKKVEQMTEKHPDGPPSPELAQVLNDSKPKVANVVTFVVVLVAIYLMVAKPF